MNPKIKNFLLRWLFNTIGVFAATYIVSSGIHAEQSRDLLVAALLLGILNTFVRPILFSVSLLLMVGTLGLFIFVINALLLYFVGTLMQPHFRVDSFGAAFWGALVITIVSLILNVLTGTGNSRINVRRPASPPPPSSKPPEGKGPIIDV